MAAGKLEIKARIRSVESTKKITKAMQLVATSKLKKQKQYMEENRDYAYYLKETVQEILSSIEHSRHPYLQKQEGKPYTIVFTSTWGCAAAIMPTSSVCCSMKSAMRVTLSLSEHVEPTGFTIRISMLCKAKRIWKRTVTVSWLV